MRQCCKCILRRSELRLFGHLSFLAMARTRAQELKSKKSQGERTFKEELTRKIRL